MSDKPEPLAAVLAEMRDLADHRAADAGGERPAIELLRSYADRIEAAAERERAEFRRQLRNEIQINNALATVRPQLHHVDDVMAEAAKERAHEIELAKLRAPGNAAALREALTAFVGYLTQRRIDEVWAKTTLPEPGLDSLVEQARAALSAPARNCDRFKTMEAARSAFRKFCRENYNSSYAAAGLDGCDDCELCETKNMSGEDVCPFAWLFAPEGGAE